jgi:3-phenylpropionate/trans-cinnamate dioxygenase ferredoxin subunit
MMADSVRVARVAELPTGRGKRVTVNGIPVALFRIGGEVFAIDDRCTHAEASLAEGEFAGEEITCPLHFACFNVRTGQCVSPPADEDVRRYETRIVDGFVEVRV